MESNFLNANQHVSLLASKLEKPRKMHEWKRISADRNANGINTVLKLMIGKLLFFAPYLLRADQR
jgi:hypothetical protein